MSTYKVTDRTRAKAKQLGVTVRPSKNPEKKLDVFRNSAKVASVGQAGALDYPMYLLRDKALAEERKRLYRVRHAKDRKKEGTPGWYADKLLWS